MTLGSQSTLEFDTWWQIESVNPSHFDLMQVLIDDLGTPSGTPQASVSPSLSFGGQQVGTTSAGQNVTVTSSGTAALSIVGVTLTGANPGDFALSANTCTGATVSAGTSCSVTVAFAPTAPGPRSASLGINAINSPQTVALSGTGTGLLTGGAQCSGTVLPGATVQLFSGGVLVATTTAGTNGSWAITGAAANATYEVRYTPAGASAPACGVTVTTNANGAGVAPVPPTVVNNHDHTWLTPCTLTPGTTFTDYLTRSNQSVWCKLAVGPQQRISVSLNQIGRAHV